MMKFVDPKNDVAFKKIFGDENKKQILISFLNAILDYIGTDKEIESIDILNPYQIPKLPGLKETILDIRAVDRRKVSYIIEMQVFHTPAFEKRVLYYAAKSYAMQLEKAEDYPRLNQVIFIGFLDFIVFRDDPRYMTRHLVLEEKTNDHYLKDLDFRFIELPKFTRELDEIKDVKEKWIYFVKNAADLQIIPANMKEPPALREAFESADQMSWSKEELHAYDAKGIYIQDERGRIELALRQGEEIGMVKGVKIGAEREKLQTALKMKREGLDVSIIMKVTGLSRNDIAGLK